MSFFYLGPAFALNFQLSSSTCIVVDVLLGLINIDSTVSCFSKCKSSYLVKLTYFRVHSLRRGAGEIFGHFSHSSSSETASPHGSRSSRSGRAPLQSLSESSGFEMLDLDPSNGRHSTETDEDDAEAVEFAILEAAAEAEEQVAVAGEQKRSQLGDVCSVPPLADPIVAWWVVIQKWNISCVAIEWANFYGPTASIWLIMHDKT